MSKTTESESVGKKAKGGAKAAGIPPLGGFSPADFNDLFAANSLAVEEFMTMSREIGEFVSKRLRADVDAISRLSGCRDLPQVLDVQIEYMNHLAEDYFAETAKLMERAARVMESGPIRTRRKTEKKPKKQG